ncbi:MAG: cyclic nucleotide-binding domain-containing protein [Caldilineaceae bacterium]
METTGISDEEILRQLQSIVDLPELTQSDYAYFLAGHVRAQTYHPTETIFQQDEQVLHLYVVSKGVVGEERTPRNRRNAKAVLKREVDETQRVILGVYDLYYRQRHSTTAYAQDEVRVLEIDASAVERLLYRFPNISKRLARLEIIDRLQTIPLLAGLRKVTLGFLADECQKEQWPADTPIYRMGDLAETLYLIDTGRVELMWGDGQRRWLGNGAAFGLLDEADEAGFGATLAHGAVALGPLTTFNLPRTPFVDITGLTYPDRRGRDLYADVDWSISTLPLLQNFTAMQRQKLAGSVNHYLMPRNHIILQQGEINDSLWVLMRKQQAQIHALDSGGEALQSITVEGPAFFGEIALHTDWPIGSTIEAQAGSRWLRLHRRDLEALSEEEGVDLQRLLRRPADLEKLPTATQIQFYPWLQPGEYIEISRRRHWIDLVHKLWPSIAIFLVLFILSLAVAVGVLAPSLWIILLVALGGLVMLGQVVWGLVDYMNDYLIVTNRRVVLQEEVIFFKQWRQEALLDRIQNVDVTVGFNGKLMGYGNINIHTAGQGNAIPFRFVANPDRIREVIFNQRRQRLTHVQAENKVVMQQLLEKRLGLRLQFPERVHLDRPRAAVQSGWAARLGQSWRKLRAYLSPPKPPTNRIIWHKHWFILLSRGIVPISILGGILLLFFGQVWTQLAALRAGFFILDLLLILVALVDLGWLAWITADWRNDTYEIDDENVVDIEKKPLFFAEMRREARLGDIENIEVDIPSPLHYILNFGNVRLQTAATQGEFTFDWVPNPRGVAAEIQRRIEAYRQREQVALARRRAQELPEWFDMYDLLGGSQKRQSRPPLQNENGRTL